MSENNRSEREIGGDSRRERDLDTRNFRVDPRDHMLSERVLNVIE